ncbi:DUF5780 domain-containing protein [Enterococcus faecium]|uniref:DUF5780 domain-containing protein n=1 Tax=Enterococcus faecium TaxID=1352 RepID=UPI0029556536|nr:DUF5780 domain-containing protein [Enterococcus faecium]EMF0319036.1 hypothetical protein [Enterococcus faecium]MDV7729825.1 DUF5780 domain-containing protein [Enterococcus faecium]MDV7859432.1 DUF5780 domain-containing protein [Enterococcus faecium]
MKKVKLGIVLLILIMFAGGCSTEKTGSSNKPEDNEYSNKSEDKINIKKEDKKTLDVDTLKEYALDFPLEITGYNIIIQDEELKSLYPDLYSVSVKNNSEVDIKEYEVALLGWDDNGLPVKIKGNIDFSDGKYVRTLIASDVNLVPGATYGENSGMELDESMSLKTLQPVILSFTDFDGNITKNENAEPFIKAIEGKKIN